MLTALLLAAVLDGSGMVQIPAGTFRPLYLKQNQELAQVDEFAMDVFPVTNSQYHDFVIENPKFRRDRIPSLFSDSRYLQHWILDSNGSTWIPHAQMEENAVVNVSWYAARAYCEWQGKKLPMVTQWEFVAQAGQYSQSGAGEPGFNKRILDWYAQHNAVDELQLGQSPANYWGVHDLHGLVWEWTEDFNSILVSGESRADSAVDRNLYCAAGSVGAADPSDYAAFMRFGFRSSLSANFSLPNLGFRCVSNSESKNEVL